MLIDLADEGQHVDGPSFTPDERQGCIATLAGILPALLQHHLAVLFPDGEATKGEVLLDARSQGCSPV